MAIRLVILSLLLTACKEPPQVVRDEPVGTGGQSPPTDQESPTAFLLPQGDVTELGVRTTRIGLLLEDDIAIDVSTLGTQNLTVISPGGVTLVPVAVSVDANSNGSPRRAFYDVPAMDGAWREANNGTYTVVMGEDQVLDTVGNPVESGELGTFGVAVPPEIDGGQLALEVTTGGGIEATTTAATSFTLHNDSLPGVRITEVTLDLSTAHLPDLVFDPVGGAGDDEGQGLLLDGDGTGVGLVVPDDDLDRFSAPHGAGYDVLTLSFDSFDPGTELSFGVDIDPNCLQGALTPGEAAIVSGMELLGSTVSVTFTDGTLTQTVRGDLWVADGGATADIGTRVAPSPPEVRIPGYASDEVDALAGQQVSVTDAYQIVEVVGPPGADVEVVQWDGRLRIPSGEAPYNVIDDALPFYANEVMAAPLEVSRELDDDGSAVLTVTLLPTEDPDGAGGIHQFAAVVVAANGRSQVSAPLMVIQPDN